MATDKLETGSIFKTVQWFSPMHKEGNELRIIYPLIYGSVLITCSVRVTN